MNESISIKDDSKAKRYRNNLPSPSTQTPDTVHVRDSVCQQASDDP